MKNELWEVMRKLGEYQARRDTEKFILSIPDLIALDKEIERLECQFRELTSGVARGDDKPSGRNDLMSAEIENAIRELGDRATPADVMRKLKSYAGKLGSCITEVAPDGVVWRTSSGKNTKLAMAALNKRLSRQTLKGR